MTRIFIAILFASSLALSSPQLRADDKPAKEGEQAEKAAARSKQDAHAQADAQGFYSLFDGKSLDGWKANENPQTFKVQDGTSS